MSNAPAEPRSAPGHGPGRQWLIGAWVSVALIPVGFLLAILVGESLASALGGDEGPTLPVMLGAALPAIAVMLLAPIAAIVCGVRARRLGHPLAIIPIILGGAAVAWAVLTNTLPLLLGGMLGA